MMESLNKVAVLTACNFIKKSLQKGMQLYEEDAPTQVFSSEI